MPKHYTIDISKARYIRLRVSAPLTRELAREVSMACKRRSEEIGGAGILSDVRGITNVSGMANNYEFAYEDMAAMGLSRIQRVAILVNP